MKRSIVVGAIVAGIAVSGVAQDIVIDSISGNGSMSFWGAQVGTTATVEWAASLTDDGRTNWHRLTNVVVTAGIVSNDIPMFFRVRGTPETNYPNALGAFAFYPLDGNVLDYSGNDFTGRHFGALTYVPDRFGIPNRAMWFNGSNTYIRQASTDLSVSPNYTLAAWVRPERRTIFNNDPVTAPPENTVGTAYAAPYLFMPEVGANAGIGVSVATNYICVHEHAPFHLPVILSYPHSFGSSWFHIAVVGESNQAPRLYVNGQYARTALQSGYNKTLFWSASTNTGGSYGDSGLGGGGYGRYAGTVDEFRLYNRALSSNEVRNLYNSAGL